MTLGIEDSIKGYIDRNRDKPLSGCFARLWPALGHEKVVQILERLPPAQYYKELSHSDAVVDGISTRYCAKLEEIPGNFWQAINKELCSNSLRDLLARDLKLSPDKMHPRAALMRDLPGFWIRPHTDTPRKVATLQIFLAHNDQHNWAGTWFYTDENAHEPSYLCPYSPGFGYYFLRTDTSWHGVRPVKGLDVRNSIMLVYFLNSKDGFS